MLQKTAGGGNQQNLVFATTQMSMANPTLRTATCWASKRFGGSLQRGLAEDSWREGVDYKHSLDEIRSPRKASGLYIVSKKVSYWRYLEPTSENTSVLLTLLSFCLIDTI